MEIRRICREPKRMDRSRSGHVEAVEEPLSGVDCRSIASWRSSMVDVYTSIVWLGNYTYVLTYAE